MGERERIEAALEIAFRYGQIDGAHHKLWVIDQMVRALTGDGYEAWVERYEVFVVEDEDGTEDETWYEWETGVAP